MRCFASHRHQRNALADALFQFRAQGQHLRRQSDIELEIARHLDAPCAQPLEALGVLAGLGAHRGQAAERGAG